MQVVNWLLRAFVFFVLFAFALNNQHTVEVHWFFGFEWHTRMVFVVLAAFAGGCVVGILAMLPAWRRRRSTAAPAAAASAPAGASAGRASDLITESRLREGL